MVEALTVVVSESVAGKRLDVFIADHLADCSRANAARLIQNDCVRVGAAAKKPGYRVAAGDIISVRIPPPQLPRAEAEPITLQILHEDDDLLVIDKPPGLVVHPAPGHPSGTLVNAVLHHAPDLRAIGGELRPGIVHRLDKDTSGILVVAKNDRAQQRLSAQFAARKVRKIYKALVYGLPDEPSGVIRLPIGRHPIDRKRMTVLDAAKGRAAVTAWDLDQRFNGLCLLNLHLLTGRTHQARVHCLAAGHPIVGDPVYRKKGEIKRLDPVFARIVNTARRQMLHAWRITFCHPARGETMTFNAPLPEDMADLLRRLGSAGDVPSHSR